MLANRLIPVLLISICLFLASLPSIAQISDIETLKKFEFRNSPSINATQRLDLLPWSTADKSEVTQAISWLAKEQPGFIKQGTKYGPVPLYRVAKRQLNRIDQPAYAAPIFVAFVDVPKRAIRAAVIHELVHIADSFRQFSYSPEWIALIAPRMMQVAKWRKDKGIKKSFSGWGAVSPSERKILIEAELPGFYAASSPVEALAEIVRISIMKHSGIQHQYTVPDDIAAYLKRTIFADKVISYAAGEQHFQGMVLQYKGDLTGALATFELAAQADPTNFKFAHSLHLLQYSWGEERTDKSLKNFIKDLQNIIGLVPAVDLGTKSFLYMQASELFLKDGDIDAMLDLCAKVNIEFPEKFRGPREYYAYKICGNAYKAAGKLEIALEQYEKAVELVPFKFYEFANRIGSIKLALASSAIKTVQIYDEIVLRQWVSLAKKGQPVAMLVLGKMYYWGTQTQKNYFLALKWLNNAQRSGQHQASYFLAELYRDRSEEFFDLSRARYWATEAAASGSMNGQYILGIIKMEDAEFVEAKLWLRRAANQNHSRAAYELGNLLTAREASGSIPLEALKWYEKAAKSNLHDAQYVLGRYYLSLKEPRLALGWFNKAARSGHVLSQFEFGMMASDRSYSGMSHDDPKVGYAWLYRSLHNTKKNKQPDLPLAKAQLASQKLQRLTNILGKEALILEKKLDEFIRKQRAKQARR